MSELISIIIPTRNRASVLAHCLEALAQQRLDGHCCEIMVVDDCSTDATVQAVQGFNDTSPFPIRFLRQPKPLGANAARNQGLERARGQIIVFLDDDVLVPPGWLEKLLEGLRQVDTPVVSGAVRLTVNGQIVGKHREELGTYLGEILTPPSDVNGGIVPVLGNMAAFRWVFERATFDETLRPPVEEIDWLRRAGVSAGFVPEAWVWHSKTREELRLLPLLQGAWRRGSEGGWWIRERAKMRTRERLPMALRGAKNCARAFGHALARRCWGGAVVGLGEFSRAMAILGLINRGDRAPESWR